MNKLKKFLCIVLYVIALFIALCSILSVLKNTESRFLKILDFPRIQLFICSMISIVVLIFISKKWDWYKYVLVIVLLLGMMINSTYLINYTKLMSVEVPSANGEVVAENEFSILIANVKMSNKEVLPLIEMINLKRPDLILAMEVNEYWDQNLEVLKEDYPYAQHTINDLSYGMLLYSKLPIKTIEVEYLNNKNVPSFESVITLRNGENISLHCIHPVPPTHFKKLPDNEGQDETALIKIGKKIKTRSLPSIIAGDVNDVVWGYFDHLTGTKDELNDVRVGRGFFNSYNAHNFFMRWPLDHVFVTDEFYLRDFDRLPKIGSDHFPIYAKLVLPKQ